MVELNSVLVLVLSSVMCHTGVLLPSCIVVEEAIVLSLVFDGGYLMPLIRFLVGFLLLCSLGSVNATI